MVIAFAGALDWARQAMELIRNMYVFASIHETKTERKSSDWNAVSHGRKTGNPDP